MIPLRTIAAFLIITSILPAFAAEAMPVRVQEIRLESERYLRLDDLARDFDLESVAGEDRFELRRGDLALVLFPDRRAAELNGTRLYLNFAPIRDEEGHYFLHWNDVRKTLVPAFRPEELARYRIRTILLDPGHGGEEPGAIGRELGVEEKIINLRLARKVAERLQKIGFQVKLTREDDRTVPLAERPAGITRYNADLFVSIHQNSATNRQASGIETFAMAPAGAVASNSRPANIGTEEFYGNRFDALSLRLAWKLQQRLLENTGAVDRGVKRARFQVLRLADCPAILVEGGFLSHPEEEKLLTEEAYLEKLADGIVAGIIDFAEEGDR